MYPSWRTTLTAVMNGEEDWNFYCKWHTLFAETFLEHDVFDTVYAHLLRYLVHGNYGYGNLLTRDEHIVAVLDWVDAKYGDYVKFQDTQ